MPASGFQVLDDMHLELNEGRPHFDTRHNFVVSGQALVPHTGGLNVSWVARALSGSPFSLTNSNFDPDRNGTQAEPLPAATTPAHGADPLHGEGLQGASATARTARASSTLDMRLGYRFGLPDQPAPRGVRRRLQRDEPHELREPAGNQACAATFLRADRATARATRRGRCRSARGSSSSGS